MEQCAAFVAIDWSDAKPALCLLDGATGKKEAGILTHTPEALEAWATALRTRFAGQPVAVGLEPSRGPLISALLQYDFLVRSPLNPATLAKYREAFSPSRAKDAPQDADSLLDCSSPTATGSRPGGQIMPRRGRANIWWSIDVVSSMTAPGSVIG